MEIYREVPTTYQSTSIPFLDIFAEIKFPTLLDQVYMARQKHTASHLTM